MPLPRALPFVLTLLAAAIGWRATQHTPQRLAPPPEPLVPHAVPVLGESAVLELDGRHLLVVGCLARGERRFPIRLESVEGRGTHPAVGFTAFATPPRTSIAGSRPADPSRHAGPSLPGTPSSTTAATTDRRTFHIHVTEGRLDDPAHYARVRTRVVRRGRAVRVLLDEHVSESELAPGLVEEIVRIVGDELLESLATSFGRTCDVDGDGTFAVVLTPWLSRLNGGRTSIDGCVRTADFHPEVAPPFGDRADVLFLNPTLRPGRRLRAVLSHEFAHAVAVSERRRRAEALLGASRAPRLGDEEDWLHEAIAHVAEDRFVDGASPNLAYRVSRYLLAPESTPLVVPDYHHAGRWRDHACRGATFSFLRTCVEDSGDASLRRLVHSTHSGVPNLESATGRRFSDLFRRWSTSLYLAPQWRRSQNGWNLGGPRTHRWTTGGAPLEIDVHATAAAFVEVDAAERRTIRVSGPPGCGLQVSLVALPSDWPRIEIGAHREGERLHVRSTLPSEDFVIDAVSWEQHDGDVALTHLVDGEELAAGRDGRDFRLVLPLETAARGPALVVKLSGHDGRGRRATGWCDVPLDGVLSAADRADGIRR